MRRQLEMEEVYKCAAKKGMTHVRNMVPPSACFLHITLF